MWFNDWGPVGGNGENGGRDTNRILRQKANSTWDKSRTEGVREAAVTQSATTYIKKIQVTVVQWVLLQLIFDVCAR